MNKKIIFLMCLLMAMVWTAGCSCPGVRPVAAAPAPVVEPAPAACPAARGCQTRAGGGARSFEEAEETRHLLDPLADILRGIPVKKANGRMDRAR